MTGEWHFIITITWSVDANSYTTFTIDGPIEPRGSTRLDTYRHIVNLAKEMKGIPAHAAINTIFFALEPDDLSAQAPSNPVSSSPGDEDTSGGVSRDDAITPPDVTKRVPS